jgi:hypothetical protein
MKRALLAMLGVALFAATPILSRPAAAAPAAVGAVEATGPTLVQKAHSARWHYIRSHYRPYYRPYRPYWRRAYYRPVYYRPVYYGRPYWHRRHYWHRHHWYRPYWHRRHHWGRPYWHPRHHWHHRRHW